MLAMVTGSQPEGFGLFVDGGLTLSSAPSSDALESAVSGAKTAERSPVRAVVGDEFKRFIGSGFSSKAVDEDAGDLVPGDGAVSGRARLSPVALEQDDPALVGLVVVEPAGPDDRVRAAAGPDKAFAAQLPKGVGDAWSGRCGWSRLDVTE